MKGEGLALFRNGHGFVDDQTSDRRRLLIRQVPVERPVEIADRHRSVDDDRAVGLLAHALHLDIVLVGNIADNLFQNVLQRHDALHLAIFVDDDGKVLLAAQEGVELVLETGAIGHKPGLLGDLRNVEPENLDIVRIAQKPWFVPETTNLKEQLNAFLRRKVHFAIVVDEYGEVQGLVTLEDILEEIVGDISDEHDIEIQGVRQEADGSIVVDGSVPIRDLNRALDWNLPDEEATTIAGLVIHETQSIPEEKQAFTFHGKRFVVMKRDKNRIARLRIRPAGDS